jgi:hypothetical protein
MSHCLHELRCPIITKTPTRIRHPIPRNFPLNSVHKDLHRAPLSISLAPSPPPLHSNPSSPLSLSHPISASSAFEPTKPLSLSISLSLSLSRTRAPVSTDGFSIDFVRPRSSSAQLCALLTPGHTTAAGRRRSSWLVFHVCLPVAKGQVISKVVVFIIW